MKKKIIIIFFQIFFKMHSFVFVSFFVCLNAFLVLFLFALICHISLFYFIFLYLFVGLTFMYYFLVCEIEKKSFFSCLFVCMFLFARSHVIA